MSALSPAGLRLQDRSAALQKLQEVDGPSVDSLQNTVLSHYTVRSLPHAGVLVQFAGALAAAIIGWNMLDQNGKATIVLALIGTFITVLGWANNQVQTFRVNCVVPRLQASIDLKRKNDFLLECDHFANRCLTEERQNFKGAYDWMSTLMKQDQKAAIPLDLASAIGEFGPLISQEPQAIDEIRGKAEALSRLIDFYEKQLEDETRIQFAEKYGLLGCVCFRRAWKGATRPQEEEV